MDTAAFHQLDTFNTNIGQVDRLLAEANTGLSKGLQTFFAALQNAADDPASTPARQLVIEEAESLSVRFNHLHDRFSSIEKNINGEIRTITEQVSGLARTIADLNEKISRAGSNSRNSPNDLLDQRDEALRRLSELLSVNVAQQGGGDINVFIGNGQPLVIGNTVSRFTVSADGGVSLVNGGYATDVTQQLNGGKLGGLINFRENILHPTMNHMGRIGIVLSDVFNRMQSQGLDLDGDYGQPLFGDINDLALARDRIRHGNNAQPQDRLLNLTFEDTQQLTTSDYSFRIMPGSNNYLITRQDDGEVVQQGVLNGTYPTDIRFDGMLLTLESGSFQGGDNFVIRPTANGGRDMEALLTRPHDLALAAPIRAGTSLSNSGTGVVSQGEVLSLIDANGVRLPAFANDGAMSPPVVIRFTSPNTYEVLDNSDPGNPVPLQPPVAHQHFIPGVDNPIFSTDPGETRVIGTGAATGLPAGSTVATYPPGAPAGNGYPAEQYTFTRLNPISGQMETQALVTSPNASAAQSAALISSVPGVSANAYTTAALTDISLGSLSAPVQITLNGESLITYSGGAPTAAVPDPNTDVSGFYAYLAEQINNNGNLASLGVHAVSGAAADGSPELRLEAASGVNLDIRFEGSAGDSLGVHDNHGNPTQILSGAGAGTASGVTVGGRIDVTMADGVSLRSAPTQSQILGDSSAPGFAQSSYLGYQVFIKGEPQAGDTFTVDFNSDATNDNRNGLRLADIENQMVIGREALSFGSAYGELVEKVGTQSSLSRTNTNASRSLLEQTQTLRDSIAGVNLDEEAANLIRFEQMYNANARVISVARDLFDTLLNAV